jgi:hypothetical protein
MEIPGKIMSENANLGNPSRAEILQIRTHQTQ